MGRFIGDDLESKEQKLRREFAEAKEKADTAHRTEELRQKIRNQKVRLLGVKLRPFKRGAKAVLNEVDFAVKHFSGNKPQKKGYIGNLRKRARL